MTYDWKEICKNKSVSELISMIRKNSFLNNEAKYYANQELLNRNIDLSINDEDNLILKYELCDEELKKINNEIENEKYNSLYNPNHQIFGIIFSSILFLFWVLLQFNFNFLISIKSEIDQFSNFIILIIIVSGSFISIWRYKRIINKNRKRADRIFELKNIMSQLEIQTSTTYN
jgi:hypothetical protein